MPACPFLEVETALRVQNSQCTSCVGEMVTNYILYNYEARYARVQAFPDWQSSEISPLRTVT